MNEDEYRYEQRHFLSRFETAFQSTRDEVQALKQSYSVLQRDINNVAQEIKGFSAKLEEKSKANWPAIGLAVSLFAISVPGLGFVLTTYTAEAVAPVARDVSLIGEIQKRRGETIAQLQSATQASLAADVNSRTDRVQLNDRVKWLETQLAAENADRRAGFAQLQTRLGEVETQFHAVSNLENLRAAQQQQINALVWDKSHPGEHYPAQTFFPTTIFQSGDDGAPPLTAAPPPR
jgi:hypothetical protein